MSHEAIQRCSDCPRLYDTEGPICDDCPPLESGKAATPEMQKMRPPIQVNDEGERYYDQEDAEDHFAYLEDQLSALRASLPSSQPVEGKKAGKYKAAPPEFTEHSEHDQLTQAELVSAAGAYLWVARCNVQYKALAQDFRRPPHGWPKQAGLPWEAWDDPIQNLNSAAALIQAEIDRLNRKAGK